MAPPDSRDIQRWYPQKWSQVAGNSEMIQAWWDFIEFGSCNMLCTGSNRTGKTRTISLGVKSVMCSQRQGMDPCGTCGSCRSFGEGRNSHLGLFAAIVDSRYSFVPIDCETVTAEQLKRLNLDVDLESRRTIIYLDEVAALGRRELENILLKPIDESPCIWIASAITVKKKNRRGVVRKTEGLSLPMLGRFAVKVGTSLPRSEELQAWILERCQEWQIEIVAPETTIPRMIARTAHRVGYIVHMLAVAASRGRRIDPDMVEGFNLGPVD